VVTLVLAAPAASFGALGVRQHEIASGNVTNYQSISRPHGVAISVSVGERPIAGCRALPSTHIVSARRCSAWWSNGAPGTLPIEADVNNDRNTRALTEVERAALDAMLSLDFDGVAELRDQAQNVRAWRSCECGCGSIGLAVDPVAPRSSIESGVAPVDAMFGDGSGDTGGLILFVQDGCLRELEVWNVGDDPAPMPETSVLRVGPRGSFEAG
jgi:hypothetical protein